MVVAGPRRVIDEGIPDTQKTIAAIELRALTVNVMEIAEWVGFGRVLVGAILVDQQATGLASVILQRDGSRQLRDIWAHDGNRSRRAAVDCRVVKLETDGLHWALLVFDANQQGISGWRRRDLSCGVLTFDGNPVQDLTAGSFRRFDDCEALLPSVQPLGDLGVQLTWVDCHDVAPCLRKVRWAYPNPSATPRRTRHPGLSFLPFGIRSRRRTPGAVQ